MDRAIKHRDRSRRATLARPAVGVGVDERGIALLLVLGALVVVSVIALTFLHSQNTTASIARNIERHGQARANAEAGVAVAVERIRSSNAWRTDFTNGAWTYDVTMPSTGGTFAVRYTDEDGDLADDAGDEVLVTARGAFGGVDARGRSAGPPRAGGAADVSCSFRRAAHADDAGTAKHRSSSSPSGSRWRRGALPRRRPTCSPPPTRPTWSTSPSPSPPATSTRS